MKGNIFKTRYCYSKSQTAICKVNLSDTQNHIKKGRFPSIDSMYCAGKGILSTLVQWFKSKNTMSFLESWCRRLPNHSGKAKPLWKPKIRILPKYPSNSRPSLQTTFISVSHCNQPTPRHAVLFNQYTHSSIHHDLHTWSSTISNLPQFIVHSTQVHTFVIQKGMGRLNHSSNPRPQAQNPASTQTFSQLPIS